MQNEPGIDNKRTTVEWLVWMFRIASAALVIITIHYVGFFSSLADDYFIAMSPTLVRRVAWELVSTLAFTSLIVAVIFFAMGLLRGIILGFVGVVDVEKPHNIDEGYPTGLFQIAGIYVAVLAVTYFPFDASLSLRSLLFLAGLAMMALIYWVFFREVEKGTKWSRFVNPLRHKELAVRALIASALLISYSAGSGLALSLMSAEPMEILTGNGEVRAVILDSADSALLIKNDDGLVLLPMHEVKKVRFSGTSLDAANVAEN